MGLSSFWRALWIIVVHPIYQCVHKYASCGFIVTCYQRSSLFFFWLNGSSGCPDVREIGCHCRWCTARKTPRVRCRDGKADAEVSGGTCFHNRNHQNGVSRVWGLLTASHRRFAGMLSTAARKVCCARGDLSSKTKPSVLEPMACAVFRYLVPRSFLVVFLGLAMARLEPGIGAFKGPWRRISRSDIKPSTYTIM